MLAELNTLKDRLEAARPLEKAMGVYTVGQAEAQQVVEFMKSLDNNT